MQTARDTRRFGNQQLDVEIEIGDRAKISLEHLAIAGQANSLAVVMNVLVNELAEVRPVLLVHAGDIVAVDFGEAGLSHHGSLSFRARESPPAWPGPTDAAGQEQTLPIQP